MSPNAHQSVGWLSLGVGVILANAYDTAAFAVNNPIGETDFLFCGNGFWFGSGCLTIEALIGEVREIDVTASDPK
jgi:hypothetical protein